MLTKAQDLWAIAQVGDSINVSTEHLMEHEKRPRLQRGTAFPSMLTLGQGQIGQAFTHLTCFLSTYYVPCSKMSMTNPVLPLMDLTIPRTFISPAECSCLWIASSNCSCRRGNRTLLDLYSLRGYFCLTRSRT